MLGWIDNTFDVRGIILLLRYPCAVVASQIRYDEDWETSSPPDTDNLRRGYGGYLPGSLLDSYYDVFSGIETRKEYLGAMWSIDNILALRESDRSNIITTHYENIAVDESEKLNRTFDFFGFWKG